MANTTTPDTGPDATPAPETPQAAIRPQEAPAAPRSANSPDSGPEAATGPVQHRDGASNDYSEPADRWKPTRRVAAHRQEPGPGGNRLTPAQLALADDLHTRALALRAASEEGLSIREAVDLAAFQLGLEAPTETAPQAATDAHSGPHEAAETAANPATAKTAREKIGALLWWSVPGSTDEEAKTRAEEMLDEHRAEVLAEVTAWLVKKAREFHASSRKREREQGDTCAVLASKIARGAVRANNVRRLPDPVFFEVDRTYTREHHGRRIEFLVRLIDITPDGAKYTAFGWRRFDGEEWAPTDSDDFTGWTVVPAPEAVQS